MYKSQSEVRSGQSFITQPSDEIVALDSASELNVAVCRPVRVVCERTKLAAA